MMKKQKLTTMTFLNIPIILLASLVLLACAKPGGRTEVSIQGNMFYIDGKPTYEGRYWNGNKVEGLLLNSRMVQGIFDDENPETRELFKYPDTGRWDPDRNTNEFVAAMPEWKNHGLNCFTINLQGGSPTGYGNKNWHNSAFDSLGNMKTAYFDRLTKILDKAEELEMVVILGYFYFGQDQYLVSEEAIIKAVDNATNWLLDKGYRNVLVEINNECNVRAYDHEILKPARVHELIERVKSNDRKPYRLLVSTSYGGRTIPKTNVVSISDYILLHGNGVKDPDFIKTMVDSTKLVAGYKGQPIVFNEDDHYEYHQEKNNFKTSIENYASWGYFDFRRTQDGETDISIGYQSVPVDWKISHVRKKEFFDYVKEISGY